ncbi:TonB-dependent receptor [Alteraurantiacibacter aquimixticola]|uniref:TonB-dependent receptor n=1 Tax=Alteraurantiacibacter aquimixticola TaxID=2489173 RepID=A0A4T3EXM1_9SPHN|nr:TonB-dependent receptor [Alteraurantiacibacter aquimixticola]
MRHVLAASASTLALLATPALAQEDAEQQDERIGNTTIVVTAQFREQALQDTPLAITAVTGEMIEARSQNDLATVADSAPNVSIRPQGSSFGPSVSASIRGIGQTDFNPAYEPGVGIYIDDVYYPQLTGAIFDTLDLERVEILRGPQGTLSGRNSLGGAIKMYSRMPNGDSSGYVEAGYGSRDRISLRAAADFAITDTLFMRVSGVSKNQDGYVDQIDFGCRFPAGGGDTFVDNDGVTQEVNPAPGVAARVNTSDCVVDKLGGVGYQALRGILRFEPNADFDFTIIADYTNDDRTVAGEVIDATAIVTNPNIQPAPGILYDDRFICGPFCSYQTDGNEAGVFQALVPGDPFGADGTPLAATPGNNRSKYSSWGVSGQMNWNLNDWLQLQSITGYREFDTYFFADGDLSPAFIGYGENDLTNWSVSQEVRLNAELTENIFATVGGYYFEQFSIYDSAQDLRYVPVYPLQFRQPDEIAADAWAAFANVAWEIVPDLNINAGIRYTEETKQQTYFRYNFDGTVNAFLDPVGAACGEGFDGVDTNDCDNDGNTTEVLRALSGNTANYEGDKIDWRVAVDYRFSDQVLAYASVATGFKGGGSNPRPFNAFQLVPFGPEELVAYEVGLKTDLLDRRLRANLSAFLNKFTDIQTGVNICPTGVPGTETPSACRVNAGDADIRGFELELQAEPVDGLMLDASLSYIDLKYKTVSPLSQTQIDDPGTAPPWKASFGAQYRIDLDSAGTLTPRFDVFYQDDQFTGPLTLGGVRMLNFLPSFTTVNARLTWRNEADDLAVSLEVTNLTDEYYLLSSFDLRGAGTGYRKVLPARPREWALTVRKDF